MSNIVTGNLPRIAIVILGLIVIGSLLFGPFSGMLEIVSTDLQRILFGATYAEAALNSARAVAYAGSCTGIMNLYSGGDVPDEIQNAWDGPVSADLPDVTCADTNEGEVVEFGQVTVTCDELEDQGSCTIHNLELPQEPPDVGWGTWIAGMGHPEYLLYYEAFPHGPKSAWEVHGEHIGAIAIASGAVLNLAFYGAAGRISSSTSGLRSGVSSFLSGTDEGVSVLRSARALASKISPWRLFGTTTDNAARTVLAKEMMESLHIVKVWDGGAADIAERISETQLRGASDDIYRYFRNSETVEQMARRGPAPDDVTDQATTDIFRRLRRNGITPGSTGMTNAQLREASEEIAATLEHAAKARSGRAVGSLGFDEPVQYASMRQYWLASSAADDVAEGMFDSTGQVVRSRVNDLTSQVRGQVEDFAELPSLSSAIISRNQIRHRAVYLACRSRIPRLVAMEGVEEGAEHFFANSEDAQAITDVVYAGSLTANSLCPGSDLGGSRSAIQGWSGAAIAGLAGTAIAAGWAGQKYMSDTQMHNSQGINTVAVKIPYVEPKRFRMHNFTNYYFMNLERTDIWQANTKNFYLVSPFTTRDLDTENPRVEIASTAIDCKKSRSTQEKTYRIRTQGVWNNGQPTVGETGACRGTIDSSQDCQGISDRGLCRDVPGCSVRSGGGPGPVCIGEVEAETSCDMFESAGTCSRFDGCSWEVTEANRIYSFPAGDWANYIHVRNPSDPHQKDTLSDQVISASGFGVKTCATPLALSAGDLTIWQEASYPVESLEVRLRDMGNWRQSDGSHNYGYDSTDLDAAGAKAAVVVIGIGLEFISGPVPTTLILASAGAAETVIFAQIDQNNAWPEH